MIKARLGGDNGRKVFFFGLSDGNIDKLKKREPIYIALGPLGGPADSAVLIHWGPTEADIAKELKEQIGPDGPEPWGPYLTGLTEEEQFPRGKLQADDHGRTQIAVFLKDGILKLMFREPVRWVGLNVPETKNLIAALQDRLAEMEKTGG